MKQNNIIKLVLSLVLYSVFANAKINWAPIMMGDITTFAPYAKTNTLQTLKDVYRPNDIVDVKVDAALSGDQDWVGVYHKNASSAWANVVAWNWVPHNGTFALSDIKKTMPVGEYEVRLFFHNKYEKKASYPFSVAVSNFQTTKATYAPNETVSVTVNVPLSGNKDWVGIFPKNADNSWGNVVAWNWVEKKGTVNLTIDKKPMPAGEYEVRLFWHNAYGAGVEAKQTFGFSVGVKIYPVSTVFDNKPEANVAKPDYLASYVDPVFHNKVTRITDRAKQNSNAHNYPKTQSWNADSTLIRLGYRIYNANNFSESALTVNHPLRGSLSEIKWSNYEPDVFYGIDGRWDRFVFMKAKINADNTITYTDMPNATFMKSEYDELLLGKYEGNLDYQDNYVVFAGRKKDTNRVTLILYHLKDKHGKTFNKIEKSKTFNNMKWYVEDANGHFTTESVSTNQMFDWATISALGNYVIVNYRSKKGDPNQEYSIEQYNKNFTHVRRLAEHGNHGDLGVDANSKEVYVEFGFGNLNGQSNAGIWMYPLDGSPRVQLLPDKYNGNHISCRNYQRPGWCYVNTRYLWKGYGVREVFAIKLDNSQTVQRFAQTHTSTQNAECTQVNVSPDGTQVLFSSDWRDGDAEDYHWDAENHKNCNDATRRIKIDTYHVKVGE